MKSIKKQRMLTGDRPTGNLHLGHYAGSLKSRIKMQEEYDCFIMVADVQALTDNFTNPEKVKKNVFEVVVDNLSAGLDPEKITYFIQSEISSIAELTVFFSNLVTVSDLQRNPTVKNEIQEKGHVFKDGVVNLGFLAYPVSQSADIAFCKAEIVPVGKDQKPMIEQARRIYKKFNNLYDEVFPLPKGVFTEVSKLNGLDGRKMSKSLDNAIFLSDSLEVIKNKIMSSKTDTDNTIKYDTENKPEISNLIMYYQIVTGEPIEKIENKFSNNTSYKIFKEDLIKKINLFLEPMRKRKEYYIKNPDIVWSLLKIGNERANKEGQKTMIEVKKAMKIYYK
ncbi:TPA: tryptophan--tRNA ligase [Patescibacteria group bacterium]|nr:MAG: Tryptophanyl-tRNA synthetase [Parcubacteria group bacterium GW2011_GWF2_40_10]KKR47347.1 MAG: Tryptophanyl-tRNA synthetase [Parcubacteria group bacterium GW2011_GWA2_40_143]KKR59989.1 MAG: Tryptophanyl-tRNA synthetase [Parcubacteria group bacterium GW2011_GWC2_40_31]KKR75523.1 MAG: Tryptophanyl-tRNA synthetase [Parcubacteria group bacterium GW2011_GWB2_40_8]KKR83090.1 MAG: Tryptophanyl-tRNA synthetase [Parcubacteria group bacterium GW2011_GWD2_40_9]HBB56837.1 tryptophan--tRNA ligase [P